MNAMTRRSFGAHLLAAGSTMAIGQAAPQKAPKAGVFAGDDLKTWPKGYGPAEIGTPVASTFNTSPHLRPTRILYPEVCAWYGALELARVTGNAKLIEDLRTRFEPLFTSEAALLPPRGNHVDFSMFGALPLELYLLTKDKRYLDLGLSYADAQWSTPNAQGLTAETRFWIDDMYMVTIVQVQAFRATGMTKYLDRAAAEMVAYLDKLQQPNGLFFHAPDVPFFWGRGNGWFAAGMTELLRDLPQAHPHYERILRGYKKMMQALLQYQPPAGLWRQLLDREDAWPESSGSGMFAFALVSGVRNGWLTAPEYRAAARLSWIALAGYVDQDNKVTSCCEGTNKLNDLDYYLLRKRRTGDFHGQAPVMWCAAALLRA